MVLFLSMESRHASPVRPILTSLAWGVGMRKEVALGGKVSVCSPSAIVFCNRVRREHVRHAFCCKCFCKSSLVTGEHAK